MNYNEFVETVKKLLSERLKPSYKVIIKKVVKNNDVYRYGLSAFPSENNIDRKISRIIYLEDFYKEYEEDDNYKLENIVDELYYILTDFDSPKFDETDYTDFNKIKDRIIFELINYEMNEKRLLEQPFIKIMDLAVVFAFVATDLGRDFGVVHITNEIAERIGLTKDEIWDIARKNTPKLLKADIVPMSSFIPYDGNYKDAEEMYIICNNKKAGGAGVILYDKILEELSSKLESDLYILPSSIHETIIIRADGNVDVSDLKDMVKNINATVVSAEDILSDKVYCYARKNNKLGIA
nr:DUF5688 family protein [uncultured Catonella sp.]